MFKANPEKHASVERMCAQLEALPVNEVITYGELADAAGFHVTDNTGRYWLQEARNRAETATGALYDTVRGVGIKRLQGDAFPDVGVRGIRRIRKQAKRTGGRLAKTRANDLSDGTRKTLIAQRAQLGAIASLADNRKTKKFEGQVPPANLERTGLTKRA